MFQQHGPPEDDRVLSSRERLTEHLSKTIADILPINVNVEQKHGAFAYVTFAYSIDFQETTRSALFEHIYSRPPTAMLDAMLPHADGDYINAVVQEYLQRAEKARQLVQVRTTDKQLADTGCYNL